MNIDNCNSLSGGISITGGYYGNNKEEGCRHGIGSFVGMTFWCRPYIDGGTNKSDIYASNVTTYYPGIQNRCNVGGLIGYTGSGAEIKNINLKGLGTNPTIGSSQSSNAAGFIGFSQATDATSPSTTESNTYYYLTESAVIIENCTLDNISVKGLNSAAGFLARSGNTNNAYYPKYIKITNCAVIGSSTNMPEIKAYGTTNNNKAEDTRYSAGGFIADYSINSNTNVTTTPAFTSVIENSYIKDYKIEGNNVGGIIGAVNQKPAYLRNLYVQNCDIITTLATANYYGNVGGIVGYSSQNLSGYNLKIEGVNFNRRSGNTLTDVTTSDGGIIIGRNSDNNKIDKFIGIGAYNEDASKVPKAVVKTNGGNASNFFVFADYMNTSADDTAAASHASSFNGGSATVDQPEAPFLTVNPRTGMGTAEYITGDGASIGKASDIYKDRTSNRSYTIGETPDPSFDSTETTDKAVLEKYINADGTYTNGVFRISTASAEFGSALPSGIDFAMLVINDDSDKAADITPFIKSYIRLVTNADKPVVNTYTFNQYAYCITDQIDINKLYQVVIKPCYYDAAQGKFVLGTSGSQGLQPSADGYTFDSSKADSASDHPCQFSLIDVQFKDPTTPENSGSTTSYNNVAYHLYVPVYTKKMLAAKFSSVTMSETKYYRTPYAAKITSEIAAGKNTTNYSTLVESTNEWTTTFIRYTYPKNQILSSYNWNFDKSIILELDVTNFQPLPSGTKLILVDPNADSDKYYTYTLDTAFSSSTNTLNLSSFVDENGHSFAPRNLSEILADPGAASTAEGHTNDLYEDYYISMYVPQTEGETHSIIIESGSVMASAGSEDKANIEPNLYSLVVLGDLFTHEIVDNSFSVCSGDGTHFGIDREMKPTNNFLKTEVTATVQIKNQSAGSYLNKTDVYHAFFISLTSHYADDRVSDIINGITPGYINNTTTYSYTNSSGSHENTVTDSYLGANHIRLNTGSILSALSDSTQRPVVTIHSVTTMEFNDTTAFPYNMSGALRIGTQVSVKSSLAYRQDELLYSALNVRAEDPEGTHYYSKDQNTAELSFNAVPADDTTDELGLKTNNRSLLGVNGKYGPQHPVLGKAIYNVDDIVDYSSAKSVQYTVSLYKKVTQGSVTNYELVNDISRYMSDVNLTDSEVTLTPDRTNPQEYVYTGTIDHGNDLDLDKMFEVNFSCNVLTGDNTHNEYANYKIKLTANLIGSSNAYKESFLIYTNAKIDPTVIPEA